MIITEGIKVDASQAFTLRQVNSMDRQQQKPHSRYHTQYLKYSQEIK